MRLVQLLACTIYLCWIVVIGVRSGWSLVGQDKVALTAIAIVLSFVVMVCRFVYAAVNGLHKRGLAWHDEVLKPERTAVVTMVVLIASAFVLGGVLGVDPPADDPTVTVLFGLLASGGLISALITNPHEIVKLARKDVASD